MNAKTIDGKADSSQQDARERVQNAEGVSEPAKIDSDASSEVNQPADVPGVAWQESFNVSISTIEGETLSFAEDWYTPAEICDAARAVLGKIDLDPASCSKANETVRAEKFFAAADDGLSKEWKGRVFLNTSYASGLIEPFAAKIVDEYSAGNITAAVVLTDNATETRWFRRLAEGSDAIVFTFGRINFLNGGTKTPGSPTRGQAFFYVGADTEKFFDIFGRFGWGCIARRIKRKTPDKQISLFENETSIKIPIDS